MDLHQAPDTGYTSIWTTFLHQVPHRIGFIDAGGIRTRFMQAGPADGPVVIMIHGTGGSLENYTANIGPMSEYFNCYAIDCVGCGLSDKPDRDYEISLYKQHIADFMQAMDIPRASFLGNSLGGWIASAFALDSPLKVDKLVLVSSSGLLLDPANSALIQTRRTRAVDDPSWENIHHVFENLIAQERYRIPDLIGLRQRLYQQEGMRAAVRHVIAIQNEEIRERNIIAAADWRRILAPTLIVVGLAERDYYISTARQLAGLIPNSRLLEMPDVGHWAMFEGVDTFNPAAISFLLDAQAFVGK